ncbi:MAG: metalloprotease TldD, partial [Gluconacetobacter diazotrophicus]|nr:metalloprotease TldD [Gluconacetobacter diazotrophicus]
MSALATTDEIFFPRIGATIDQDTAARITRQALEGVDDGELFLEYRESEFLSLEGGVIRSASFDTSRGFGLRTVLGDESGFAHSDEISERSLLRAADTVAAVRAGRSGIAADPPRPTNRHLYGDGNPLRESEFAARAALLGALDAYARGA